MYDVAPEVFEGRRFDLVFMGALLCHLRDPIGALMAARSVCGGRVIASTPRLSSASEMRSLAESLTRSLTVIIASASTPAVRCWFH